MYGIYANIWGIFMVNVSIYTSTMDPMGFKLMPMASRDHIPIVPSSSHRPWLAHGIPPNHPIPKMPPWFRTGVFNKWGMG